MIFQGQAVKFQGVYPKQNTHLGNLFEARTFLGMPGVVTLIVLLFGSHFGGSLFHWLAQITKTV